MVEAYRRAFAAVDHRVARRRRSRDGQRLGEGIQSIDPRRELTERLEVIHEDGQRGQDRGEGPGGLDDPPDLQLSRDHPGRDDHARQDDRHETIGVLEAEAQGPPDQLGEVAKTSAAPRSGRFLGTSW
jgi:hypothetical protein